MFFGISKKVRVVRHADVATLHLMQMDSWNQREADITAEFLEADRQIQLQYQLQYGEFPSNKSPRVENYKIHGAF